MNRHLSSQEFADALEGSLASERLAHAETCATCRAEVEELRAIAADLEMTSDVREPSPLFWTYFSERVKEATRAEAVPSAGSGWRSIWRPVFAAGLAMAVLALIVFTREAPIVPPADVLVTTDAPVDPTAAEDSSWELVLALAGELESDDVRQAATPRLGTADAVIEDLSPAQRKELARLIRAEIGNDE